LSRARPCLWCRVPSVQGPGRTLISLCRASHHLQFRVHAGRTGRSRGGAAVARQAERAWSRPARHGVGAGPSKREGRTETPMLEIYGVILRLVAAMRPCVKKIEGCDADLARQMRRAMR